MIPTLPSSAAPTAFGEADTAGYCWMVHYKGQLVHKDGLTFRFRGQGDDFLVVRVGGKIVLNGSIWFASEWECASILTPMWKANAPDSRVYTLGNFQAEVGDWITLEPGVPVEMDVIIGEGPGGEFDAMLVVEVKGVDYPKNKQGGPILPMFTTAVPSHDLLDTIIPSLIPGEASLTNGPVFCDY